MSFFQFAWIISWITFLMLIPQDLVKAASSIGDLFHQHEIKKTNPFCQVVSELNSQTLTNNAPPGYETEASSTNFSQNALAHLSSNWFISFQNLFNFQPQTFIVSHYNPPQVKLISTTFNPSSLANVKNSNLTAEIQPIAYLSYQEGEPKFTKPKNFSHIQDHQVWVNNQQVISIEEENVAKVISQRLDYFLSSPDFDPEQIYPTLVDNKAGARIGDRILFLIDDKVAHDDVINNHLLAVQWVNNLRMALKAQPLGMLEAQLKMYNLKETDESFEGTASWYGPDFHGRLTANGEIYNQYGWTAAHPSLKLGTYIKITNLSNHKDMILRINDRGPYIPPRTLDLSLGSAWCLDTIEEGVIPYKAVVMKTVN